MAIRADAESAKQIKTTKAGIATTVDQRWM